MSGEAIIAVRVDPDADEPLVQQLQRGLRAAIVDGRLPAGDRLPSMRQIADELGVSLGVVKQAINTLTAEGYLRSSPRRGVFVDRPRPEVRDVALVLPMLTNEQMMRVIAGVRRGLAGTPLRLVIHAADADYDVELRLLEQLSPRHVVGAIVYPPGLAAHAQTLRGLRERGIPAVQVAHTMGRGDDPRAAEAADGVSVDGFGQGRLAAEHVLGRGHRRIGLVDTTADTATYDDIREGMQAALAERGLGWGDLERVAVSEADLNPEQPWANGERAAERLLGGFPDLTALIGINPHLTLGCYRAAEAAGRGIGGDFGILAIGSDLPSFALLRPGLDVVDTPMNQIGERAARHLRKLIDQGGEGGGGHVIELPPRLIERGSVPDLNRL